MRGIQFGETARNDTLASADGVVLARIRLEGRVSIAESGRTTDTRLVAAFNESPEVGGWRDNWAAGFR